jgi:hypothetical protein
MIPSPINHFTFGRNRGQRSFLKEECSVAERRGKERPWVAISVFATGIYNGKRLVGDGMTKTKRSSFIGDLFSPDFVTLPNTTLKTA